MRSPRPMPEPPVRTVSRMALRSIESMKASSLLLAPVNSIVYTRRIGAPPAVPDPQHGGDIVQVDRTARILGAAKVTGNLRPGTAVGQLLAYVDETNAVERLGAGPLSPTWTLRAVRAAPS